MAGNRRSVTSETGEIRRWMQALALTAVLMAFPVPGIRSLGEGRDRGGSSGRGAGGGAGRDAGGDAGEIFRGAPQGCPDV